ncbi:helix-turn-helix transcriptional regulator [Burkholderia humptydooensis]|uniref:Helix-turn-helix transcriptional regulator n=3 Tax=pseudomallei group TaxID=111527 RepID=A0A7T2U6H4_9BURK|nr:helix-turn-helix domain protein [Burkholderia sp. 2002721687]QPS46596.1 helix-turn-helix transcriptional regulator [Burkholderia humptydooensis]
MRGPVTMLNAFVSPNAADAARMPDRCCVYGVSSLSSLLKQLLDEAVDVPAMYDIGGRDGKLMALLVAEMASMRRLSLHAPLPIDPRLARACRRLFDAPSIAIGLDAMAAEAGMSRRTMTRLFRMQTGESFAEWREQVCLLAAIERLSEGQAVTRVALDRGYASPSAFPSAFRRVLGEAPTRHLEVRATA